MQEYVILPAKLEVDHNQDNQSVSLEGMQKHADQMRKVGGNLLKFYDNNKLLISSEREDYLCRAIAAPANVVYYMFLGRPISNKCKEEIIALLKRHYPNIYSCLWLGIKILRKYPFLYPLIAILYKIYKKSKTRPC